MAYTIVSPRAGVQPIADTSSVQNHSLGTIVRAYDPTYGEGEFIYLLGVGSTVVGSVVTYHVSTHQTALSPVLVSVSHPLAVAMSVNLATFYGWYQISGLAVALKLDTVSLAAGAAVGILSIGKVAGTAATKEVSRAVVAAVASATTGRTSVVISINRPVHQGRIS